LNERWRERDERERKNPKRKSDENDRREGFR
jgi:hypothetical protein